MSYAFRARKKAMRRALDAADPERRQVRRMIRRGIAPRFTMQLKRFKYKNVDKKYLVFGRLRYTFGVLFKSKETALRAARNEAKPKGKKSLLAKITGA